jgi:hypothetical protein
MASTMTLELARHVLRRAHEDAVRRNDEADTTQFAAAHEEICELLGKQNLLMALCNLSKDQDRDIPHMAKIGIASAAIGLPHAVVFDLETPTPGWVKPESTGDSSAVAESG